ncbi:hypothetical protein GCM10009854_06380 [Saccharopolyspora halophila]|uniref:Type II toxin-antitoxin system HicA family toxin n=1 Tax=Saccharopolyspora halophila TaxID=405551 RepID=A0ABN3FML2_9PSEU
MVNRRLRLRALLALLRRQARQHGFRVEELPGRGKGSHRTYVLIDAEDTEAGRITLPDHRRELSWTVLRSTETRLAPQLGDRWMEEK